MTSKNKLIMGATAGFAAILAGMFLFSKPAAAAQNAPSPGGISPTDGGRGQFATALAQAIQSGGGYCGSQAAAVVAYEQAAGLSVDAGYPGTQVMTALRADLATMGTSSQFPLVGTLPTYAWSGGAGWTAGNVPQAFVNNAAAWTAGSTCSQ